MKRELVALFTNIDENSKKDEILKSESKNFDVELAEGSDFPYIK